MNTLYTSVITGRTKRKKSHLVTHTRNSKSNNTSNLIPPYPGKYIDNRDGDFHIGGKLFSSLHDFASLLSFCNIHIGKIAYYLKKELHAPFDQKLQRNA